MPKTDSEKRPVRLSDKVHFRLEYHEVRACEYCKVRLLLQNRLVQSRGRIVQHLWLLTCADCYVVEGLFRLFGFFVVVDYQNLQSTRSQGCEELVYFFLGVVVVGGYAYSLDSTRNDDV